MLVLSVRSIGSRWSTKKLAAPFEQRAPLGRDDRAGEPVPRQVLGHALADEPVERPHRRGGQLAATRPGSRSDHLYAQ